MEPEFLPDMKAMGLPVFGLGAAVTHFAGREALLNELKHLELTVGEKAVKVSSARRFLPEKRWTAWVDTAALTYIPPANTWRMAAMSCSPPSVFMRNPRAPARSARCACNASSCMETTSTSTEG